jgi:hypothetical protein
MEEARIFLENALPVRRRGGTMISGSVEEFGEAQTGSKLGKIVIGGAFYTSCRTENHVNCLKSIRIPE